MDGRGSTHWTPRECPYCGDTESGSRAVAEQRRCSASPGVSTKRCQGEKQRRKGLCKMGSYGAQRVRAGPAAGGLLRAGTRLLPRSPTRFFFVFIVCGCSFPCQGIRDAPGC